AVALSSALLSALSLLQSAFRNQHSAIGKGALSSPQTQCSLLIDAPRAPCKSAISSLSLSPPLIFNPHSTIRNPGGRTPFCPPLTKVTIDFAPNPTPPFSTRLATSNINQELGPSAPAPSAFFNPHRHSALSNLQSKGADPLSPPPDERDH